MSKVLVTGATGFIGSHLVWQLLEKGYRVKGTYRPGEEPCLEELRSKYGSSSDKVEYVEASLSRAEDWIQAVEDVTYVVHSASPFTMDLETDVICRLAVDGVKNIFAAIATQKDNIKKVIMTSSVVAVMLGHSAERQTWQLMTEDDWTIEENVFGYWKSKPMAERLAWKLADEYGLSLDTILPAQVYGPVLGSHHINSLSSVYLLQVMRNEFGLGVDVRMPITDVRDVAKIHILAMERSASGDRFICSADDGSSISVMKMSSMLYNQFSNKCQYKPPLYSVPPMIVRLMSYFNEDLRKNSVWFGNTAYVSNKKAKTILGMDFRSCKDVFTEQVFSLFKIAGLDPKGYPEEEFLNYEAYPNHL